MADLFFKRYLNQLFCLNLAYHTNKANNQRIALSDTNNKRCIPTCRIHLPKKWKG